MNSPNRRRRVTDADYVTLLQFRNGLRRFLHWSEGEAKAAGLTGAQYQLLLAIRGHAGQPSVGDVAGHLMLRHHSAVELVDRAERSGLVARVVDSADQRVVRLALTDAGEAKLAELAATHLEQLSRLRPSFESLWKHLPES
jgi:DNA-binding MarR family transcriptional regulator